MDAIGPITTETSAEWETILAKKEEPEAAAAVLAAVGGGGGGKKAVGTELKSISYDSCVHRPKNTEDNDDSAGGGGDSDDDGNDGTSKESGVVREVCISSACAMVW